MLAFSAHRVLGILFLVTQSSAQAVIGPVADLYVYNKVIAPDGFNRSAVVVDGQHPAPLIKASKGDRFSLNVHNNLTDNTMERALTIHWHGLFQRKTNWADGVAMVTQCPIIPGESFLYDFTPAGQTGTYWYHSHFGEQYCDGLRGPLIIYDPDDPFKHMYDVDDESTVLTISDWQHLPTSELPEFPPTIDSILFNGKGRYYPGGPKTDLAVVAVEQGKRYRMRLLSLSCDPNFIVWIDGHDMTVIEADGELHKPVTVGSIQIFSGQRYSFILNAKEPVGNYWIWAQTGPSAPYLPGIINSGVPVAIVRYLGANDSEPTATTSTFADMLNETQLHPLVNPEAPGEPCHGCADVNLNLPSEFFLHQLDPPVGNWTMNHAKYEPPSVPVLLQIMNGVPAQKLLPSKSVYSLPPNKVIEISFPVVNEANLSHPIHLHGHSFSVVRSAGTGPDGYNYINPPRRDVVSLGNTTADNVTIRFVTDNPGPWLLHCHIDYHLAAGFAVVLAEDVQDTVANDLPVPLEWNNLCPAYAKFNSSSPSAGD
ncbi:multicopper oxidase [Neolentinus lepideus HHB14362 ss-1]|uniref:Multicopper oxidase n=1 Tax=Neolentinus lepideus HHB14362 ss-1 TaxID=1314782 RepID=A0A165VK97_9AGAM|nr:multicopper oxidase [Neolentinus lepideus HHB14362 ss-1]